MYTQKQDTATHYKIDTATDTATDAATDTSTDLLKQLCHGRREKKGAERGD